MIEKGRIVERGTHETLLTQAGVYKKLVLRQLSTSHNTAAALDDSFDLDLLKPAEPNILEGNEP